MKKLLNIITVIGYLWLSLALLFKFIVPETITEQLPFVDSWSFLFSGISLGALSSVIVFVKNMVGDTEKNNLQNLITIFDKLKETTNEVDSLKGLLDKQNKNIIKLEQSKLIDNEKQDIIIKQQARIIELNELELESRATNPYTDKDVKEKIKAVLGDDK